MRNEKVPLNKILEILLIEDNTGDILLIKEILEDYLIHNINITVKTNGCAASNLINQSESSPDLIILDINLPCQNGFELLAEIRNNEKFRNKPVVIFSSSCNLNDISTAIAMGVDAFITKPVDFGDYKNQVLSFLNFIKPSTA